jgi:N-acetylglucosaminyldiphosphoundecaprenol N-acetyl-beta-D-mannosaminyltransferase
MVDQQVMAPALQTLPAADGRLPTVVLGGVPVTRLGLDSTLSLLGGWLEQPTGMRRVATANLDFLEIAQHDDALQHCLGTADIVTADGEPLIWLSRLRGHPIPERVAGADFVPLLVGEAARRGKSVYFLGGSDGVADEAIEALRNDYPELVVAGSSSPFLDLADAGACRQVALEVAASEADLVLVAFGCPKQDFFIERYLDLMNCRVAVGVGGTFNFIAGRIRRAPRFLQRTGLEWVHRLAMEPHRLVMRYWRDGICFLKLFTRILLERAFNLTSLLQ